MFEHMLDKLTKMEENIALLVDLYTEQTNSLTTYKQVAKILGLSSRTLQNYIKDSTFVIGTHYYINAKRKVVFIPQGIIEFKKSVLQRQNIKPSNSVATRVMHPIASKVLQGVA